MTPTLGFVLCLLVAEGPAALPGGTPAPGPSTVGLPERVRARWGPGGSVEYRGLDVALGPAVEAVRWARRGRERGLDLFAIAAGEVRIWEERGGRYLEKPTWIVTLPAEGGLVDLGDVLGDEGAEIIFVHAKGVFACDTSALERPAPGSPAPGEVLFRRIAPCPRIPLPLATTTLPLVADVFRGGKSELLLPTSTAIVILRAEGGGPAIPPIAEGAAEVILGTGGPDILDSVRLGLRWDLVRLSDLDGDGRPDIQAWNGDRLRLYLQGAEGFGPLPSAELDLAFFDESEGKTATASSDRRPEDRRGRVRQADIDGDGLLDLAVGSGRFIRMYFGGPGGFDFSRPFLALKLSSELRGLGCHDFDGDGRLDIVAVKYETPGLPRLIAAYFASMSLSLEVLGYRNEGGRKFSRRPERRATISISFPPIREIVEDLDRVADRFLAAASRRHRFAVGDLDGDGTKDAIFLDDDGTLRAFLARNATDRLGDPDLGRLFLQSERTEWGFEELMAFLAGAGFSAAREAVRARSPDLEAPLGADYDLEDVNLEILDINEDGLGDVVVRVGSAKLYVLLSGPGSEATPVPTR